MINIPVKVSDVEYYLIKRKPKKGKPIFHARFFDSVVDKDGRRKIKYSKSTGQTSEAAAHQVIASWIEDGKLDIVKTNLASYLLNFWDPEKSEYLKNKARQGKTYSNAYLEANVSVIERLFLPYFKGIGVYDLTQLTPDNLESWMQHLDQDKDVSGRTANRARQAVWVALNFAVKKRFIRVHPGASVEKNAENLNKREAFSLGELETLFNLQWDNQQAYTAALLAFYTGARLGEVRGLRWKNVFLDEGFINIVENYIDYEGLKDPKWESFREGIDIPPEGVEALKRVKAMCDHEITDDDFVFYDVRSKNKPIAKEAISNSLAKAMKAAEITGKTFHSLRHSFITHLGPHMRPAELRYLVGHSNETTTERYQHRTQEGREAIKKAQRSIIPFKKAQ